MIFFKKKGIKGEPGIVYSVLSGEIVPIENVPDEVISNKILGDGLAILPADNKVYAPVSGTVTTIADTHHALGIVSDDGAEIMVHLGIDTVSLEGRPFTIKVKEGQRVKAGEVLLRMDIRSIQKSGCALHSVVTLVNSDLFKIVKKREGLAIKATEWLFAYRPVKI